MRTRTLGLFYGTLRDITRTHYDANNWSHTHEQQKWLRWNTWVWRFLAMGEIWCSCCRSCLRRQSARATTSDLVELRSEDEDLSNSAQNANLYVSVPIVLNDNFRSYGPNLLRTLENVLNHTKKNVRFWQGNILADEFEIASTHTF